MRLSLLLSALCLCVSLSAQTPEKLKDLINKNDIAIKSVHKNMIAQNLTSFTEAFKEILKKQEAGVKNYSQDKNMCASLGIEIRNECLIFLKKNYKGSTDFYELTADESLLNSKKIKSNTSVLTESEIKAIDNSNVMEFQSLSNLTLTIQ